VFTHYKIVAGKRDSFRMRRNSQEILGRGARSPFGGPEQVLNYSGRYTYRVAISNHRLDAFQNDASFLCATGPLPFLRSASTLPIIL